MLVDLGLINFSMKTDAKFLFTLQRNMNKLFETTKKAAAIPDEPDVLIQFHLTIYDSYDLELAAKMIQSIKFENTTSKYSLTGKLEYDYKNHDKKTMLYKMFVAYNCNG